MSFDTDTEERTLVQFDHLEINNCVKSILRI